MNEAATSLSLQVARRFNASRERVFQAWTSVDEIKKWWAPPGFAQEEVQFTAEVGGSFRIAMKNPEGDAIVAVGQFKEVVVPERLVYSWNWEGSPAPETIVTVEFVEEDGGTHLTLTHEGFPDQNMRDQHEQGWTACMERVSA